MTSSSPPWRTKKPAASALRACCGRWSADAAIVAEPTDERLCIAHRGWVAFDIETHGRAAHGSRPDLGVDAIAMMGRILVQIETLDRSLQAGSPHPLLGTGSVHASLIEGGQEYSSYPARCLLSGERRTIPGELRPDVEAELRGLLGDADASISFPFGRDPLEVSPDEEIVRAVQDRTGSPDVYGAPFWTDAALFADAGIPAVLYGPKVTAPTPRSSGSTWRASSDAATSTSRSRPSSAPDPLAAESAFERGVSALEHRLAVRDEDALDREVEE